MTISLTYIGPTLVRFLEDSRGAVLFLETSNFLFIEMRLAFISVLATLGFSVLNVITIVLF